MDLQYGLLLGFLGCTATFVGFFIAFLIINYNMKKDKKKKEPLSSVEKSLKDLNSMPGSKAGDDCQ